jgi:DNA invertase Pin-like site-specific DNA recombinase
VTFTYGEDAMTRCAIYARFSTEKQSDKSVDDQLRECAEIAKRNTFVVVAQFSDAAISGGTAERPGYQAMLEAARRGEFDVIVAEDVSRLWRNLAEQAPRLAELADLGVEVVTHDLDTRTEAAAILGAVLGASNSAYRKEIGRRTRRGLKGRALAGQPTGGRAYGYTSKLEVVPEEAAVVREVFERRAAGESMRAIARDLNGRGAPSPRGRGWHVSALHALLRNERYVGRLTWGASRWRRSERDSSERSRIEVESSEWITAVREDLRLVSEDACQRVRARDTPATYGSHQARPKYPLSGLLLCAECGRAMTLSGGTNSRGYGSQRYVCPEWREHTGKCSNRLSVSRLVVEEFLIEPLRERLLSDQNFLTAFSALQESDPEKSTRKIQKVASATNGADANAISGGPSPIGSPGSASGADDWLTIGGSPSADALLATKLAAIESAAAVGALSRREADSRCAALRAEHERSTRQHVPADEASLLANAERLRAALVSAATDALRDALRRTLGTVRCKLVTDDGPPYLMATFEGGDYLLLEWLAIGDRASKPGLSALVAGACYTLNRRP